MRVQQCPYCEHSNPVEAKFCNDCGSPLHLKPCPACATLADSRAEACASCGAAFPDRPILTVHPLDDPVDADDEPIVLTERIDLQDPVGLNDPIELPEPVGLGDPIDLGDPIGLADPTEPATVSADSGPGVPHVSLFDRIAERGLRSASVAPPVPPGAQAQPVPSTSGPIETPAPATPAPATTVSELPAAAPAQPDASDESFTHPTAGPPAAAPGRRRARLAWIAFVLVAAALAALLVNRDRGARDPTAAPHGAGAARVDAPAHDASIAQPAGSAEPAPAAAAPAAKATSAFPAKAPAASPAASPAVAPAATAGAPAVAPAAAAGPTAPPTSPATAVAPTLRARGPEPATASPTAAGRIDCTRAVAALGLCDTPLPKEDE